MRLWSLHPRYLDPRGLVALWREALLAQTVFAGATRGYRQHPQLERFRAQPHPVAAVAAYLRGVHEEGTARDYRFDRTKIISAPPPVALVVTSSQLAFEWEHLLQKLRVRTPALAERHQRIETPLPHPLFVVVPGPVSPWERGTI